MNTQKSLANKVTISQPFRDEHIDWSLVSGLMIVEVSGDNSIKRYSHYGNKRLAVLKKEAPYVGTVYTKMQKGFARYICGKDTPVRNGVIALDVTTRFIERGWFIRYFEGRV